MIEIDFDKLRQCKLFIATPMHGDFCTAIYTDSLCRLLLVLLMNGIQFQYKFMFGSIISQNRNYLVDHFMASDFTNLLFVDSDMGFTPENVLQLLMYQAEESPYDILGGVCLQKKIDWNKIAKAVKDGIDPTLLPLYTGNSVIRMFPGKYKDVSAPVEVQYIGTGFTMMKRSTFDLFRKSYPFCEYIGDTGVPRVLYYNPGLDEESHFISEDFNFCRMIRNVGGKVFMAPEAFISHVGLHVYGQPIKEN